MRRESLCEGVSISVDYFDGKNPISGRMPEIELCINGSKIPAILRRIFYGRTKKFSDERKVFLTVEEDEVIRKNIFINHGYTSLTIYGSGPIRPSDIFKFSVYVEDAKVREVFQAALKLNNP